MRLGSGPECDWVLGPNAIGFWARMRLGSGPECDWVPGPNEIRTWDKMRHSDMVEMRGEGDSVGYRWHSILPIMSDHAVNVAAFSWPFPKNAMASFVGGNFLEFVHFACAE